MKSQLIGKTLMLGKIEGRRNALAGGFFTTGAKREDLKLRDLWSYLERSYLLLWGW